MLGQRILTAIVLLAILAGALWSDNAWWFIAILAFAAACATWEWLRLTLSPTLPKWIPLGVAIVLFGSMLGLTASWLSGEDLAKEWLVLIVVPIVALIWLVGATSAVLLGRSDGPGSSLVWSLFSVPACLAAWSVLALSYANEGGWFVVSMLALVWVADIAAYFVGRAIGKRKLAPKVSPGKTVAGAVAGVLGAALWVGVSSVWEGSFGHTLVASWSLWLALPIAAVLGCLSIVGDLFESLLKRRAVRKDSSALLPGHGGFYDRIDAILPVAPVALLLSGVLF